MLDFFFHPFSQLNELVHPCQLPLCLELGRCQLLYKLLPTLQRHLQRSYFLPQHLILSLGRIFQPNQTFLNKILGLIPLIPTSLRRLLLQLPQLILKLLNHLPPQLLYLSIMIILQLVYKRVLSILRLDPLLL